MSLPRYSNYRNSGTLWLGDVPAHWHVTRLKYACSVMPSNVDKKSYDDETPIVLCNYTDVYYNDKITNSIEFMPATASEEQISRFTLRGGDTLITKDSETADDIAISAYVPEDMPGVVCGYHLAVIRPKYAQNGLYIKRLFDSHYLKACFAVSANGLTRVGLSQYALDNLVIPLPPPNEQSAISVFLESETRKIDALIAEQEKLLELLVEKRQATISRAVTRGLDPDVPMKDSGVKWLGVVPAHWNVAPLAYRYDVQLGKMLDTAKISGENLRPYLRVFDVQWGRINIDNLPTMDFDEGARRKFRLKSGDILVNEGGSYPGRSAIWSGELDECYYQKALHRLRPLSMSADVP